jgi:hypothetical protein
MRRPETSDGGTATDRQRVAEKAEKREERPQGVK